MKLYYNYQSILLIIGISIFSSYLFQIYWGPVSVNDGVVYVEGGSLQRFLFKFLGISLVYIALIKSFSFNYFVYIFH